MIIEIVRANCVDTITTLIWFDRHNNQSDSTKLDLKFKWWRLKIRSIYSLKFMTEDMMKDEI